MSSLASAPTPTSSTFPSIQQSKIQSRLSINASNPVVIPCTKLCSSDLSRISYSYGGARVVQRSRVITRSSSGPAAPGSVLQVIMKAGVCWMLFFLVKALAEIFNERIETTIGEFLGVVGRLQAEQQKQVQEVQLMQLFFLKLILHEFTIYVKEEVSERAKRAKEKAALIPKSTTGTTYVANGACI